MKVLRTLAASRATPPLASVRSLSVLRHPVNKSTAIRRLKRCADDGMGHLVFRTARYRVRTAEIKPAQWGWRARHNAGVRLAKAVAVLPPTAAGLAARGEAGRLRSVAPRRS